MGTRQGELFAVISTVFLCLMSCVKGEIRCYCNQAACVSTGYMCKSSFLCFSNIVTGMHGCLERRRCAPGLHCCEEDMCNYMHFDSQAYTHKSPMTDAFEDSPDTERMTLLKSALQREIWFKAAVIAVPIGGMCILILLAVAAAKMLRQDTIRQRRLLELRRIYGYSLRDSLLPWSKVKDTTIV